MQTIIMPTKLFFENALKEIVIEKPRKDLIQKIATTIIGEIQKNGKVNLNFICTHNSRRSQLAQIWSWYASDYFGLKEINSFSGGTEATALFRNTAKTLQEVGFNFQLEDFSHQNPHYLISYENCKKPILGYSKLYDDKSIKKPFIAITTCSSADENCPFIPDAAHRFHLPFEDPKQFDNTEIQRQKYLETNKLIAGEIHFLFTKIAEQLKS